MGVPTTNNAIARATSNSLQRANPIEAAAREIALIPTTLATIRKGTASNMYAGPTSSTEGKRQKKYAISRAPTRLSGSATCDRAKGMAIAATAKISDDGQPNSQALSFIR